MAVLALGAACRGRDGQPGTDSAGAVAASTCDTAAARAVVENFGQRLKNVSLLAPDSIVERTMSAAYTPFVAPELLRSWIAKPLAAPGRQVSSPWPERIAVDSVSPAAAGGCRVTGAVVYMTSADHGDSTAADREPVVIDLTGDGGWRIRSYREGGPSSPAGDSASAAAADVVRRYYAAIADRDFRLAYSLWGDSGRASRQSYEEFAAGFARTAQVGATLGAPGRVDAAAGSRYVTVPVIVRARTVDGEDQRFEGTYTLRRTVVDGASAAQRRWHIYTASLSRVAADLSGARDSASSDDPDPPCLASHLGLPCR